MIVIGIYDSHNSSASLSIDGEIVCAIQEERFTKRKNEIGFPKNAVSYILKKYDLSDINIDIIAMSTVQRTELNNTKYPIDAVFEISDYIDMMEDYWKPKLSGKPYPKYYVRDIFKKNYEKKYYTTCWIKTKL